MPEQTVAVMAYSPWDEHMRRVPMYPVETRRTAAKRRLENIRRLAWEARLREWLSGAVSWAAGDPHYNPPAPDGINERWRWANWIAFTGDDALLVALVRTYGCRCVHPLLGWTTPPGWNLSHGLRQAYKDAGAHTPRCRTCNAEAPGA